MKKTIALLLPLLGLFISIASCQSVDLTLVGGSVGTTVVEACISKIVQSGIFSEDYNFLRNLAYVETNDGNDIAVGQTGGIWKVSSTVFNSISDGTIDVSSYYDAINTNFGIAWGTVTYDDMSVPLHSALAQRLYMAYLEEQEWGEAPTNSSIQGFYWARNISDSEETIFDYETAVAEIDTGCIQPERDVVFLIDTSITSGISYFIRTKEVISNIVRELEIDTNLGKTVVGIGVFSDFSQVLTYLNAAASEGDVLAVIDSVLSGSNRRLASFSTLIQMNNFFSTENGARGSSTGTPQVMCVFLGGESDDMSSLETAAADAAVNIIAVGMTSTVTQNDLDILSSGGNSERSFLRSNYSSSTALEFAVVRKICSETGIVTDGQTFSGEVPANGRSSLSLQVPESGIEIAISSSGPIDIYYSALNNQPSSATYDYSLAVPNDNLGVTLEYVPNTVELDGGVTVTLYISLESSSDSPTKFTLTVDVAINATTTPTEQPYQLEQGSSTGLSDGEIAGIVLSCLVVLCVVLVAIVYYRFGKPWRRKPLLGMHSGKLDKPMKSRTHEKGLERNVRERLHSALRRKDLPDLHDAVEDFIALRLDDDDGDFVQAQKMIVICQCKQALNYAMSMKNIKLLEKAIFRGRRMEYDVELKMELVNGEILLQDLKKIDNLLRRLKRAIDVGDTPAMEAVTAELRVLRGCDQATVDKMLLAFQLREDIEEAMNRRDIKGINESIARILEKSLERELAPEVKQGRKMVKDLAVVEKVSSIIKEAEKLQPEGDQDSTFTDMSDEGYSTTPFLKR